MIAEILERVAGENSVVVRAVSAVLVRASRDSGALKDNFATMTAANDGGLVSMPVVSPEFNICAFATRKRPVIFKDSFFSNKGPRLKISRRVRPERSNFRAFKSVS